MLESDPIISKVLRPVVRPDRGPMDDNKRFVDLPKSSLQWPDYEPRLTLWNQVRLIPYISQFIYGVIMKNWKTTISGVVGGVAYLVNAIFGLQIPSEAIIAVSLFLVGLFSQDAEKTQD